MGVLVTAASRHGATEEIARALRDELAAVGVDASFARPEDAVVDAGVEAVVVGSAVYFGRWLEPARRFVHDNAAGLAARPVWIFSSGPVGDGERAVPRNNPVNVADVVSFVHPLEHRIFGGRLDRETLSLTERAFTRTLRAPEGDFRDWDEIRDFARRVAASLVAVSSP